MFYMAEKYGLVCKGLTLSHAQAAYIEGEIRNRKLEHLVSVEVRNIHDMEGTYDYIASVGVLEHVSNYDDLYRKTAKCLKESGSALFHSMFHREPLYQADPFILKYIFRKGSVPHIKRNLKIAGKYFGYVDRNDLPALSYPKTLACWYEAFCENEAAIRKLLQAKGKNVDIDFSIRTFKHYLTLAYCGLSVKGLVANILVRK